MNNQTSFLLILSIVAVSGLLLYFYRLTRAENKTHLYLKDQHQQLHQQYELLLVEKEQLEKSVQRYYEMDATKDKFFSIIGHDLRSPLNTISGFLKMLNDHVEAFSLDELKNFAQSMNKSVSNLLSMLDNLLQWSRSQSGVIEYKPREIALRELVDENIYLIIGHADSKGIFLNMDIPEDFTVWADVNMLNVIIRNLLTNAVKFTRKGGSVTLKTYYENEKAAIIIADTGVGMSKERQNSLFLMNQYQTEYGTAQEKGNGLGLVLCHEFVQRNGGSIHVQSKLGEGTTFTVFMPIMATV